MKIVLLTIVVQFLLAITVYADVNDDFSKDLAYIKQKNLVGNLVDQSKKFDPHETFKHYTNNPKQTKYFSGVTQGGDNNLLADAAKTADTQTESKSVIDASTTRPKFDINKKSPMVQKSSLIQSDSYNITHGISDKYVDCKVHKTCKMTYETRTCDESQDMTKLCTKTASVKITKKPYLVDDHFDGKIKAKSDSSGDLDAPENGSITHFDVFVDAGRNIYRCGVTYKAYLGKHYISSYTPNCGGMDSYLSFSNSHLNIPVSILDSLDFHFEGYSRGEWSSAKYKITVKATKVKKKAHISWSEVCRDI